jgi:hypothetical protein
MMWRYKKLLIQHAKVTYLCKYKMTKMFAKEGTSSSLQAVQFAGGRKCDPLKRRSA